MFFWLPFQNFIHRIKYFCSSMKKPRTYSARAIYIKERLMFREKSVSFSEYRRTLHNEFEALPDSLLQEYQKKAQELTHHGKEEFKRQKKSKNYFHLKNWRNLTGYVLYISLRAGYLRKMISDCKEPKASNRGKLYMWYGYALWKNENATVKENYKTLARNIRYGVRHCIFHTDPSFMIAKHGKVVPSLSKFLATHFPVLRAIKHRRLQKRKSLSHVPAERYGKENLTSVRKLANQLMEEQQKREIKQGVTTRALPHQVFLGYWTIASRILFRKLTRKEQLQFCAIRGLILRP